MNEAIKYISYVQGFLTALGAVMQAREMTNGIPGHIMTETRCAVNRLRGVEAFIKGMDCMIDSRNKDAENYEAEIAELKAKIEVMREASERTGHWETVEYEVQRGETEIRYRCSECGRLQYTMTNYCPDCGAMMEASGDD